jgi:hypothetical protein
MYSSHAHKIVLSLILFIPFFASATIIRVNNTGAAGPSVETSLITAIAGASVGDTIIVEHSSLVYDSGSTISVDKDITIFGTGYFLADNAQTQADTKQAIIDAVEFVGASAGAEIAGLEIGDVTINVNSITVHRCNITGQVQIGATGNVIGAGLSQNFIKSSQGDALVRVIDATNFFVQANYIHNTNSGGTNNMRVEGTSSGLVLNNLFYGDPENIFKNGFVQNNIFEESEIDVVSSTGITVEHNMCKTTFLTDDYPLEFNISLDFAVTSIDPDSVLCHTDLAGVSRDGEFQLNGLWPCPGNPACNAGADGNDIGMFGGTRAYVLSGMPPIPSVFEYSGSATGTNTGGTTSTVKGKSRR